MVKYKCEYGNLSCCDTCANFYEYDGQSYKECAECNSTFCAKELGTDAELLCNLCGWKPNREILH